MGLQDKLYLGNLDAKRDWGFAGDYVEAMWMMLQHESPDDYVVATGEAYSVREFLERSFGYAGMDWKKHVETDPRYLRPAEVDFLMGDRSKITTKLGWTPRTSFQELVTQMVDHDMELASQEQILTAAGHKIPVRSVVYA
jgi:GDPmannose 4,6-dehydratase